MLLCELHTCLEGVLSARTPSFPNGWAAVGGLTRVDEVLRGAVGSGHVHLPLGSILHNGPEFFHRGSVVLPAVELEHVDDIHG